jgi:ketosteroid isomerase-like protein
MARCVAEMVCRRAVFVLVAVSTIGCTRAAPPPRTSPTENTADVATVRREIDQWYEENKRAFQAKDLAALMALRAEDVHSVTPDGVTHDRAEMERSTRAFLDGIERWIAQDIVIDSLEVSGDTAQAVVHQHLIRMARRSDGQVHRVETWVTQREVWRRTADGWKLYRVDTLHDQRRLIDGQPG